MAEGIKAVITADTTSFVKATKNAADSAKRFQVAMQGAASGALKFTPALNSAVPKLNATNSALRKTTGSFKAMKGATQQLGFQIQDISVQLAGGQNAMLVLGQQGSQIASIFGPGGAVIGAVLAVASAIGVTLFKSLGGATKKTSELVKAQNALLESMRAISLFELNDQLFEQAEVTGKLEAKITAVTKKLKEQEGATSKGSAIAMAGTFARINALTVERKALESTLRLEQSKARVLSTQQSQLVAAGKPGGAGTTNEAAEAAKKAGEAALAATIKNGEDNDAIVRQFREGEREAAAAHQLHLETIEQEHLQRRRDTMRDWLDGQSGMIRNNASGITELVRQSQGKQAALMTSSFATMLSATSTFSKKAFKANKILSASNTIVNGIDAVTGAFRFGSNIGGPLLGAAMAGAAATTVAAQLKSIQAQQFGGGGGGGAAAAPSLPGAVAAPQAAAPAADPTLVNITLEGEVFGRDQVRGLIGQINEAVDDGFKLRFT